MFETIFLYGYYSCWCLAIGFPIMLLFQFCKWSIKNDQKKEAYERLVKAGRRPPKKRRKK